MEGLARRFAAAGHRIVGPGDRAELCIFNSCAVTHVASRKSRKMLRQLRRRQPSARLVATGCYADLSRAEVESLGVDLVVPNRDKDRLPELLAARGWISDADPLPAPDASPVQAVGNRTRAFVKVQDGCDNRCTFCIVTVARGVSRSRATADVVGEVRQLLAAGYGEVVLSGVHLGAYGHDRGDREGLRHLVERLLGETDIGRLRLSSLEPWDLTPDFFDLWRDGRLLPHLHLPLQSGNDATLARMARRTNQTSFACLVDTARAAIPGVAISTDVIVGFPGECDAEFEDSLQFTEQMAFSRLHVFRYSPRQGTAAYGRSDRVDDPVAQARSRRVHALGARLEASYRLASLGTTAEVLWETSEPYGDATRWSGLTGNYLRVVTDADDGIDLGNRVTSAELLAAVPGVIYARIPRGRQETPFDEEHDTTLIH